MIASTTSSRLSILDRVNLNPLFCCAMMRGRVPQNNTRAREGGRKVVRWNFFMFMIFVVK
jgi:hypothetical protein